MAAISVRLRLHLGDWQGGQTDYLMVPYADWNLLKFPDKDRAMAKIKDLAFLSDILPTGFHGCVSAEVGPGSTVYIAGAGPVGRAAAGSRRGHGPAAAGGGEEAGYEVVDLSKDAPLRDQIEAIFGQREVDCGVDCVRYEGAWPRPVRRGRPGRGDQRPARGGACGRRDGLPPVSIPQATPRQRPQRSNKEQGTYAIDFGKAWIKSPSLTAGQCPVKEGSDETYREW